jgi:hypothetical protein
LCRVYVFLSKNWAVSGCYTSLNWLVMRSYRRLEKLSINPVQRTGMFPSIGMKKLEWHISNLCFYNDISPKCESCSVISPINRFIIWDRLKLVAHECSDSPRTWAFRSYPTAVRVRFAQGDFSLKTCRLRILTIIN